MPGWFEITKRLLLEVRSLTLEVVLLANNIISHTRNAFPRQTDTDQIAS